ncbi:MAG: hypothetical protein ACLPVW_11695 [Terriglobales bacterium]
MTVCFFLFIPINHLTILSSVATAGGLYFLFAGFGLLARKRLLLATPTSKIGRAAPGLVEVTGVAAGPYTTTAPLTGKPCFLYRTTAWQQRDANQDEWEKIAEETLHLPFFLDDSTSQLLIEPLGANLDLRRDFRQEYAASLFSSDSSGENDVPPRVSVFLLRHGIAPARRLCIEERAIKPNDALFITGTLMENPGVQVRPLSPYSETPPQPASSKLAEQSALPAPQIIRLSPDSPASTAPAMSQQARIAAALNRAGITKPEAWSAAHVPYASAAVEENAPPETISSPAGEQRQADQPKPSDCDLAPPVVLMKGANHPTFVISFRSQKEFAIALAWKSAAMIWGGAAITLLGLYTLWVQMASL